MSSPRTISATPEESSSPRASGGELLFDEETSACRLFHRIMQRIRCSERRLPDGDRPQPPRPEFRACEPVDLGQVTQGEEAEDPP